MRNNESEQNLAILANETYFKEILELTVDDSYNPPW
jgi:hypothetical protein